MSAGVKRVALGGGLVALLALAGCATLPDGPTYAAMPGSRSTFDQFQVDDYACRQYSTQAIGGSTPQQNANNAAVGSAVIGTAIGAAIGAAVGGHEGAAVGAGMGLFTGAAVGSGNAQVAGYSTQQRYDNAYYQCMYSRGHKVPMPASAARSMRQANNVGYPPPPNAPAPAPYVRPGAPPPNAAIPPPNAPPPNAAVPPPNAPPPNAATPPPNAPPPPYQPR